ncbi:hypothetical protein, partial [Klebsiella pneumoniae]|uniref:hypothetical protein n=1 Tax=Klebsiella pneumoniae TaxID=573 RepID=UPI0032DBC543
PPGWIPCQDSGWMDGSRISFAYLCARELREHYEREDLEPELVLNARPPHVFLSLLTFLSIATWSHEIVSKERLCPCSVDLVSMRERVQPLIG